VTSSKVIKSIHDLNNMLPKEIMMIKITISIVIIIIIIIIIITGVEISGDRSMIKKGTEKTLKY
jgi:uncharacterized membrane protein YozB (DUF420 family)